MSSRERVLEAFDSVRREDFLPPEQRGFAPLDRALNIGYQQTNSQPTTVRDMLELLDVRPGHKVLDVGCGSGWTTALLGELVGSAGQVHGVEIVPELVAWGPLPDPGGADPRRRTGRAGPPVAGAVRPGPRIG